jgi:hypothetical protein
MHISMHQSYACRKTERGPARGALACSHRAFPCWIAAILVEEASGGAVEDATAFAVYHLTGLAAFFHTAELKAKRGST